MYSMYQKTSQNIKKYELDLKFYNDDNENEKYIQYKQELEQNLKIKK